MDSPRAEVMGHSSAIEYFPLLAGVRALTVRPPWSWGIAHAGKSVENRTQPYGHRGALLVHAGKEWDEADVDDERITAARFTSRPAPVGPGWAIVACRWCGMELCLSIDGDVIGSWRRHHVCDRSRVAVGAVEALTFLGDCHTAEGCCRPWGETSYVEAGSGRRRTAVHHLVLEDTWALPQPIECRGYQGLWVPGADVIEEVARQLLAEQRRLDVEAGSPACVVCGCTNNWGCLERCSWATGPGAPSVCSTCF